MLDINTISNLLNAVLISLFGILSFSFNTRLKNQIDYEYKIKEQAQKIAEYAAITYCERMEPEKECNRVRANQLAWELLLFLPEDLYTELTIALDPKSDPAKNNIFKVLIKCREYLRKEKSSLTDEKIFFNKPIKK